MKSDQKKSLETRLRSDVKSFARMTSSLLLVNMHVMHLASRYQSAATLNGLKALSLRNEREKYSVTYSEVKHYMYQHKCKVRQVSQQLKNISLRRSDNRCKLTSANVRNKQRKCDATPISPRLATAHNRAIEEYCISCNCNWSLSSLCSVSWSLGREIQFL